MPLARPRQVSISYVDCLEPRESRQQSLRQRYCFDCACDRCRQPRPAADDFLHAVTAGVPQGAAHVELALQRAVDRGAQLFLVEVQQYSVHFQYRPRLILPCLRNAGFMSDCGDWTAKSDALSMARKRHACAVQGNAAGCRQHLVAALHSAVRNGAHPLHFRCQEGYCLLVSACRAAAATTGDGRSLAAAAVYALASAVAADALVAAGARLLSQLSPHWQTISAPRQLSLPICQRRYCDGYAALSSYDLADCD